MFIPIKIPTDDHPVFINPDLVVTIRDEEPHDGRDRRATVYFVGALRRHVLAISIKDLAEQIDAFFNKHSMSNPFIYTEPDTIINSNWTGIISTRHNDTDPNTRDVVIEQAGIDSHTWIRYHKDEVGQAMINRMLEIEKHQDMCVFDGKQNKI